MPARIWAIAVARDRTRAEPSPTRRRRPPEWRQKHPGRIASSPRAPSASYPTLSRPVDPVSCGAACIGSRRDHARDGGRDQPAHSRRSLEEWECLEAVSSLWLPDWYIAAGFLRNAIWDALHAKSVRTPLNDIDVIYYDAGRLRDGHRGPDRVPAAGAVPDRDVGGSEPSPDAPSQRACPLSGLGACHGALDRNADLCRRSNRSRSTAGDRRALRDRGELVVESRPKPTQFGIRPRCSASACGRNAGSSTGPGSGSSGPRRPHDLPRAARRDGVEPGWAPAGTS